LKKKSVTRKTWLSLIIIVVMGISSISLLLSSFLNGTKTDGSTNSETNGENNHQANVKIVGKKIPSGYVMGNIIDIELLSGIGSLYLENSEERISIRFTAQLSGEVSALAFNAYALEGDLQVRVGLQEDSDGRPKGEWISEDGFEISKIPNKSSFITINLQRTVRISNGTVYHIVIEATEIKVGEKILIRTYLANALAQPLNYEDPDIIWHDPKMNTLFYDGEKWREENKWPIFVVNYTDGRYEGQPYSLEAPWVIYRSKYVGQTIIPASDYSIGKIAFVVSVKGEPSDKLYYEIRDQDNKVLVKGLFATADQLTIRMTWIEVSLTSPVEFTAGKLYRIVLLSPETDLENPYHMYGHEFGYNSSIGYGGLQHQLTTSTDAGTKWIENKDADAVFKLIQIES
jgi:hypothetical protein